MNLINKKIKKKLIKIYKNNFKINRKLIEYYIICNKNNYKIKWKSHRKKNFNKNLLEKWFKIYFKMI